jgi:hypothetical protein
MNSPFSLERAVGMLLDHLEPKLNPQPPPSISDDWRAWLAAHFASYAYAPFAPRHERLWDWLTRLKLGEPRPAHITIWPRGGAKSTSAELGCGWVCERNSRRFALYVCGTQDQADKHIGVIATVLEKLGVERALNMYGYSKGWRRQEVRAANGFNAAGFGLDAASRGVKLDEVRPDLVIFDDVDDRHDSPETTRKKIESITQTIIPAGSPDCAVLFIQNMVHAHSVAAQLVDGRAEFLLDREPVSIQPAVEHLEYERREVDGRIRYFITAGSPTWEGQNLAVCESQMNKWGRRSFLREAQHNVSEAEHGLWLAERDIEPFRVTELPPRLMLCGVGVDPTCSAEGDEAGIISAAVAYLEHEEQQGIKIRRLHGYVFADESLQGSPSKWATAAVTAYNRLPPGSRVLIAEKNQGGEMVETTIKTVPGAPDVELIAVHEGKAARAEPVQKLYEEGFVHHVGYLPRLEAELTGWEPGDPSPNRLDALVEILTRLMLGTIPEYEYKSGGTYLKPTTSQQAKNEQARRPDTVADVPRHDDDVDGSHGRWRRAGAW